MKKALTTLLMLPIILTSSFSVISCDKYYQDFFNSIESKIKENNDIKVFGSNISPSINDGNTIFAIKNALNLTLNDMDYVTLEVISNNDKLILNKTININCEIKVLDHQEIITTKITWEKNIDSNIFDNNNINNIYTLLNKETYVTTNNGLYLMNDKNNFEFKKVITDSLDNYEVYDIYQVNTSNIYIGTNYGLYYSNNGIVFYKDKNIINGNIYQIIDADDGAIYINWDHDLYYSIDNGMNFKKMDIDLKINNIVKYQNNIYLCTNNSIYLLNKNSIEQITQFENLGNVQNIYWVTSTSAYIYTDSKLYYYNNIKGDYYILLSISKSVNNTDLGTEFSITKIKNINNYLFLATNNGIFYIKNSSSLVYDFILNKNSNQKIFSYYPYTLYNFSNNFKGINIIIIPINIIFQAGN